MFEQIISDDANTTVNKRASGNMTLLKKMALSLYRMMKPLGQMPTISEIKRLFAYGYEDGAKRLLAQCDKTTISNALTHYRSSK